MSFCLLLLCMDLCLSDRGLHRELMQQGGLIKETWMDEDPREAILKYADAAEKDPKFIAPAYAQTQPEPLFAKSDRKSVV